MTHRTSQKTRRIAVFAAAFAMILAVPGISGLDSAFGAAAKKLTKEEKRAQEAAAIRAAVQRGEVLPLPRILAIAQSHVAGEVIKVELEQDDGIIGYEIKILAANGRVREVKLNAQTGALIEIEDD